MAMCPCCRCVLEGGIVGTHPLVGSSEGNAEQPPFEYGTGLGFCDTCVDLVNSKIESEGLHWFVSHIVPEHVSWSSHPKFVRQSPKPFAVEEPADDEATTARMLQLAAQALHLGGNGSIRAAPCASGGVGNSRDQQQSPLKVLVVAGAGMSCDSGLPDFRGKTGFYRVGGDEVRMEQINFHEEAGPKTCDIQLTWWYIASMMRAMRMARPHEGYQILKKLLGCAPTDDDSGNRSDGSEGEDGGGGTGGGGGGGAGSSGGTSSAGSRGTAPAPATDWFVFTSNIDGYFVEAGFDHDRVHECHGSLEWLQCSSFGVEEDEYGDPQQKQRGESVGMCAVADVAGPAAASTTTPGTVTAPPSGRSDGGGDGKSTVPPTSSSLRKRKAPTPASSAAAAAAASSLPPCARLRFQVAPDAACDAVWRWPKAFPLPVIDPGQLRIKTRDQVPRCSCGALARPNVSHTTDEDRHINMRRKGATGQRMISWLNEGKDCPLVILEIGCGTSIHSLREESEIIVVKRAAAAKAAGRPPPPTTLIRIDPANVAVPRADAESARGCGLRSAAIKLTGLEALRRLLALQRQ